MLLNGTDSETSEHAMIPPNPGLPNQALQVLALAQRTAEEHVASAQHHADKIRTDALAAAEQIARDAQAHANTVRREADRVLAEARAGAEQMARDAQSRAEDLKAAMEHRTSIDLACGVIMAQNRCTQEQAMGILTRVSSNRNQKLRDVAAEVLRNLTDGTVRTHVDT